MFVCPNSFISGELASSGIPVYIYYISWPKVIILHSHESLPKIILEELEIHFNKTWDGGGAFPT